jgi:gliding motility-associated lipoprotein GldH
MTESPDMQRALLKNNLCYLFLAVSLASCGSDSLVEISPDGGCWKFSQKLETTISHPGGKLDLPVRLSLNSDYPFSNMYLHATLKGDAGKDTSWTVSHTFVDPLGKWAVEARSGTYQILHPVLSEAVLPPGTYSLFLRHDMRPERICGVESVAVLNKK